MGGWVKVWGVGVGVTEGRIGGLEGVGVVVIGLSVYDRRQEMCAERSGEAKKNRL